MRGENPARQVRVRPAPEPASEAVVRRALRPHPELPSGGVRRSRSHSRRSGTGRDARGRPGNDRASAFRLLVKRGGRGETTRSCARWFPVPATPAAPCRRGVTAGARAAVRQDDTQSMSAGRCRGHADLRCRSRRLPTSGCRRTLKQGGPPRSARSARPAQRGGGERQLGARPVFLTLLLSRFSLRRLPLCLLLSLPGFLVVEKLQSVRS